MKLHEFSIIYFNFYVEPHNYIWIKNRRLCLTPSWSLQLFHGFKGEWLMLTEWMDVSWNFERIWTKQKREYATEEKNFNKNVRLYLIFMGMSLSFKM